jgi:hypothetical protein
LPDHQTAGPTRRNSEIRQITYARQQGKYLIKTDSKQERFQQAGAISMESIETGPDWGKSHNVHEVFKVEKYY